MVLKVILSFASTSKFVPVMDTEAPAIPIDGLKLVMVGAPELAATVKFEVLETEPEAVVTVMGPVVAANRRNVRHDADHARRFTAVPHAARGSGILTGTVRIDPLFQAPERATHALQQTTRISLCVHTPKVESDDTH